MNNQKWAEMWAGVKASMCRLMLLAMILTTLAGAIAMFPWLQTPAAAAGGRTVSVIGIATGTTAIQLTASPATFYEINVASGTLGGTVKCWNVAAVTNLADSSEVALLDAVLISSAASTGVLANFQDRNNGGAGKNASAGIACKKSAAGDLVTVEWQP